MTLALLLHFDNRDEIPEHVWDGDIQKFEYKDFTITYMSPDWDWVHKDFDGAPDANDSRYGYEKTVNDCIESIEEWYADED